MAGIGKTGSMSREINLKKAWQYEGKRRNACSSALFPELEGKRKLGPGDELGKEKELFLQTQLCSWHQAQNLWGSLFI